MVAISDSRRIYEDMIVTVAKWGNSLGVRVPKALAEEVGMTNGTRLNMHVEAGSLVITPARPRYTLAKVLENVTPELAGEFDWGPDVGREIVE